MSLPAPVLTPGAVRTTDRGEVCTDRHTPHTHHTKQYRHCSRAQADRILAEYGLPPGPYGREHEIDHLVPLSLGGADTDDNLWPEPRRSIEPVWNAERKDRLEWRIKRRFFAVLHIPPIMSPLDAVRAAIVAEHRSGNPT